MKKILIVAVSLGLAGAVACGLSSARLLHSLETPEFRVRVAQEAGAAIGARVQLESLDVSFVRGIKLGGVRVRNPPGFGGDLLTVEAARLSYDLWPLLRGRVQVDELTLRKPVITLASDASGAFNYQRLAVATPPPKGAPTSTAASARPSLVISKLSVDDARFLVLDERKATAFRLEGASLDSGLAMEAGVLTGTGNASVDSAVLANALFLRGVRAPIKLTKDRMSLSPLKAGLAGGAVTGDIEVHFKPAMRYAMQIAVSGADVATLLREAGSAGTLTGSLDARSKVEGTSSLTTLDGSGSAQIRDCRWPRSRLFAVIADLLQVPELRDPRFDECRVEFTVGSGQARTPLVSFKGKAVELGGHGVTNLATTVVDYDLVLALAPGLMAKVPAAIRAGFKTRSDGFGTVPFKVTGTTAAPKTDLATRLGKTVAIEAAKEGLLGRLFGKKKQPQ